MSVGGIVGAVVGGVIGYFCPALGVLYGASLGFGLGMMIDPMTPDIPSIGAPDQGKDQIMSSEVGVPIADLTGTAKTTGHLLCYGKERSEPIYSKGGGGKGGGGGSKKQITGYKYYMSWAVGIIAGKTDVLYTIYRNEDIVWEGELSCPASGGKETITLDEMGSATFYFGTDDHALNSKVGALLDDPNLNTPYRNLCWCFFDDCYIGKYNRTPTMKFVITKIPTHSFSSANTIQTYDCNPAHSTWYVLHDLLGLPESWLHSNDFAEVALTLWNECRGVSILFSSQQSALSYLESISSHIDGILRYGTDGKFHPKLIRDDYTVEDLSTIDEDVMLEEPILDRRSWIDTLNEMKVQYSELTGVERCRCDNITIGYTTQQMSLDEEQTLSVENPQPGCAYVWEITSGGGSFSSLTETSVNYIAASSNENCDQSPIISLSTGGKVCDTLAIAINAYGTAGAALKKITHCVYWYGNQWRGYLHHYYCDGSLHYSQEFHRSGQNACNAHMATILAAYDCVGFDCYCDVRSAALKQAGCCPFQLLDEEIVCDEIP